MEIKEEIFHYHFWGDRVEEVCEEIKKSRYEDFIKSKTHLGKYLAIYSCVRPGTLVRIKPMFSIDPKDSKESYVAIFMEAVNQPRAGERWFVVFHNGELKQVLDYELDEVLIDAL